MHQQPERRETLPDHPVPAGLAAPEAWRLRVDGLVAQPLALSVSKVEGLGPHTHAADFVCAEGWSSRIPRMSSALQPWCYLIHQ
jgi:DMSO/TMAO reductase YedYZ molybdopterin-dependent catalytic subunit